MDPHRIGKFIYELRTEKGLSQNQLAKMVPISYQAVSKWENGITIPDSSTLLVLKEIFNVSIDELLLGRRFTKEDLKSDIHNSIILRTVDEINKKEKNIRRLRLGIIISVLFFIIVFLSLYFIDTYNSIKVFTIEGTSNNFKTVDGIFITTKDKIYFRLGDLDYNENINVEKVELYYSDDKNERKIIESDSQNIFIRDYYGYELYFNFTNLNLLTKNLYLRITFNDNQEEIIHLVLKKDFANNNFFSSNKVNNSSKDNEIDKPVFLERNDILEKLDKLVCNEASCNLVIDDNGHNITYTYIKELNHLNIIDINDSDIAEWNYFIDNNVLTYNFYKDNNELENITISIDDTNGNEKYIEKFYNYIINHLS